MFGSYNAGRGTLLRAQRVAEAKALDQNQWSSIEVVAPDVPRWRHEETLGYLSKISTNVERMDDNGRVARDAPARREPSRPPERHQGSSSWLRAVHSARARGLIASTKRYRPSRS